MATIITIKTEENLTKEQQDALQYLFGDAIYEFKSHRWPAEEYLEKNYPGDRVLTDQDMRAKKLASIKLRNDLAELLHNPVLRLESVTNLGEGHDNPNKEAFWHKKYEASKADMEAHIKAHRCGDHRCDVKECLDLFVTSSALLFEAFKQKEQQEAEAEEAPYVHSV